MKREYWSKMIVSIIYILLGLILIIDPTKVGNTLCYLLAAAVGVMGVIYILSYMMTTVETRVVESNNGFAFGVVLIVLAIFIIAKKSLIISLVPFIFGFMITVKGILGIQNAMNLKRFGYGSFKGSMWAAVLVVIFGLVVMLFPFQTAKLFFVVMGIGLVLSGAIDIVANLMISRQLSKMQKGTDA